MISPNIVFWIFTVAQLILWIYIVSCFSKDVFFNLYVNRARTLLFKPVTFVQSIAPRCPEWVAATILLVFTLLLHCAFAKASDKPLTFLIGDHLMLANLKSLPASALFSLMTFIVILCQINLIRILMMLRFGKWSRNAVIECLDTVCSPLSIPKLEYAAAATAACLLVSTTLMALASSGSWTLNDSPEVTFLPSLAAKPLLALKLGILSILDILMLFKSAIAVLVIISIGGLVTGKLVIMGMANEWLSSFSRIFVKNPLTIGVFDITPLIIYYLADFVHSFLVDLVNGLL